jgi:hypothetical protein
MEGNIRGEFERDAFGNCFKTAKSLSGYCENGFPCLLSESGRASLTVGFITFSVRVAMTPMPRLGIL